MNDLGFFLIHVSIILIAIIFLVVIKMKGKKQIHYAFLFLMSTLFIWDLGAVLLEYDYRINGSTNKLIVYLAYIGIIFTPVAALFLGLIFANTKIKYTWNKALLLVIPLISTILLFTNEYHRLFYKYIKYEDLASANSLGQYFIIHTVYSYICITVGMGYLIYFSIKNVGFFSNQSVLILLGIVISFGYNLLLTAQVIRVYFSTNVIVFILSVLFFFFAIFKFDFLNVVPIALQSVVDHISDSFIVFDKGYCVIDYNKTFLDTFGDMLKIKRRDNILEILNNSKSDDNGLLELYNMIKIVENEKKAIGLEKSFLIAKTQKIFLVEITPINKRDIYLGTIILLKDITQAKNDLETIQRNHEILMEQERLASLGQLIGGIAHNLKTPIMSLAGGIEALKDLVKEYDESIEDKSVNTEDHHEIAAEMINWLTKMKPYCSYMSEIISAVKGQAVHMMDSTSAKFSLDELIKRVDILMKHELKTHHCVLNIDMKADVNTEFKGEVNNLVQIFDNIILNAMQAYVKNVDNVDNADNADNADNIKNVDNLDVDNVDNIKNVDVDNVDNINNVEKRGIVEKGRNIDFTIERKSDNIVFEIRDYGKGIPIEVQNRIFKEMVTTKGKNGTGLGLYMSYSSIKGRFGGNMWYETYDGRGTAFFISIPCLI